MIERLKKWDAEYGLVLRGVGFDWVEAEFKKQPADMRAFAEEVFKFCPDVVTQGTETVERLADEMQRENTLYLWWELRSRGGGFGVQGSVCTGERVSG